MIVGTAGHIDHGKTALVKALTGVDADRLAEEKARGITIELGFAYLPRPDGSVLGFVDVPGHERFMKTMLAGATGVDFVLLVVAADDGVMPQTCEHLAVVELLGLTRGAVVLTKCDLADDARLDAVEAEVRDLTGRGPLAGAPVLRTSAATGTGIAELLALLDAAAATPPTVPDGGAFRFTIDRSFSLQGVGTVVTGVVRAGQVAVGDTVTVSPGHDATTLTARVRALHVQNRPAQAARRGDRCGINLGRVEASALHRGDMLVDAGLHAPTRRIDARLHLLPGEARPLRHWAAVRLHHGAAEVAARVAVLQDDPLAPGQSCPVQLVLDQPIAAAAMDRFVIRSADGSRTLGGGQLIDLAPPQRRRKQAQRLEQLAAMEQADPARSLAQQLGCWPWFVDRARFMRERALGPDAAAAVLAATDHVASGAYLFGPAAWQRLAASALAEVALFHQRFPQLLGPNLQRLVIALDPRLPKPVAQAVMERLVATGELAREAGVYRMPGHRLGLDRADDALWRTVQPLLAGEHRFRPQRVAGLAEATRTRDFDLRRVLKAMTKQGQVMEVAPDHFFLRATMVEVASIVGELAQAVEGGLFGAAALRDRLEAHGQGVGRKVVIQMLEQFDRLGLTLRREDQRLVDPRRLAAFVAGARD